VAGGGQYRRSRSDTGSNPVSPTELIPTVAAYRYVRSKGLVQPEPRKEAEIKKLYGELIALVTLRTLAEALDITPVTLVSGIVC